MTMMDKPRAKSASRPRAHALAPAVMSGFGADAGPRESSLYAQPRRSSRCSNAPPCSTDTRDLSYAPRMQENQQHEVEHEQEERHASGSNAPAASQDSASFIRRLAGASIMKAGSVHTRLDRAIRFYGVFTGLRRTRRKSTASLLRRRRVQSSTTSVLHPPWF